MASACSSPLPAASAWLTSAPFPPLPSRSPRGQGEAMNLLPTWLRWISSSHVHLSLSLLFVR
jgi:hypothetical protein